MLPKTGGRRPLYHDCQNDWIVDLTLSIALSFFFTECCCTKWINETVFWCTQAEMLSLIELLRKNNAKNTIFTSLIRSVCFNIVTSLFSNFCCHFVIRFLFHFNLVLASNRQRHFPQTDHQTTQHQISWSEQTTKPGHHIRPDQETRSTDQTRPPSDQTNRPDHQIRPIEQTYKPADPLPTSVSLASAKNVQPNCR